MVPADIHQRLLKPLGGGAAALKHGMSPAAALLGHGQQEVLGGDEVVLEPIRLDQSAVEQALQLPPHIVLAPLYPGNVLQASLEIFSQNGQVNARLLQHYRHQAVLLLHQSPQQVQAGHLLVSGLASQGLGGGQGFAGFDG